jgi:hypothetical protein
MQQSQAADVCFGSLADMVRRSCNVSFVPKEGPCADSVEKHEPASDVATVVMESLKALDPNRPIREADSCTAAILLLLDHLVGASE